MRKTVLSAAAVAVLWGGSALAVTPVDYPIPYVGAAYLHELSDSQRDSDNGNGFQLNFGWPLGDYGYDRWAAELTFHSLARERDIDGRKDYQAGLMLDLVYDLGTFVWNDTLSPYLPKFKPFLLGGVGVVQEDVRGNESEHFGLNLGAGALFPLPWYGLAARFEARVLGQLNDETVPDEDVLIDYRVSLGLQVPLTPLFPVGGTPKTPGSCDLAVVDMETGRADCGADSDQDGAPDAVDECPMTPAGTQVNARGCPVNAGNDEDGDGVPNDVDACPGTQKGLLVDARGCVISQNVILRGVNFEYDSARLTSLAKRLLDDSATTLKNQTNLKVLIAGHTDGNGEESYNLALSKQRAESVRQYLIGAGVEAGRLTADGYGESQPVASNDSGEGRAQNRRVEFRLETQ